MPVLPQTAGKVYHPAMTPHILAHISDLDPAAFLPLGELDVPQLLDAQAATAHEMLIQLGSPEHVLEKDRAQQVRDVFGKLSDLDLSVESKKEAILSLKVPQAVRHIAGMLTAYDWEYVEQNKQMRAYAVAKIIEETKHPDAKIRLRALELLGKVTEVGIFTERLEIKKVDMTDAEIDAKIKEKLNRFMGVVDVVEAEVRSEEIANLGLPRDET